MNSSCFDIEITYYFCRFKWVVELAGYVQFKYLLKAQIDKYLKVASTSLSPFEAYAGFFRLFMKGKFDVYLLWPFGKKLISIL